jgi:hypothetical protein
MTELGESSQCRRDFNPTLDLYQAYLLDIGPARSSGNY